MVQRLERLHATEASYIFKSTLDQKKKHFIFLNFL